MERQHKIRDLKKRIGLTKGVLTIVEILKPTVNNKNTMVRCVCSKCGQYSDVRLDRMIVKAPYAEHYCIHCRENYFIEKAKEKYVGTKNGVLECIDIVKANDKFSSEGKRTMAICKCSICGSITEVRAERLSKQGNYIPQSCSNCSAELYRRTTQERYYKIYGCTGQEYIDKKHDARRLLSIVSNAKGRNIPFLLTDKDVKDMLHQNCYYCGRPHANGIDRVDSKGDYSLENCVPCCSICNIMKNKFDTKTFFEHIKLIYNKHFNKQSG